MQASRNRHRAPPSPRQRAYLRPLPRTRDSQPTQVTETDDLAECSGCPDLGMCCHHHLPFAEIQKDKPQNRFRLYSSLSCSYLDDDKLCSRYDTRHLVPWCGAPETGALFPSICKPHHRNEHGIGMWAKDWFTLHAKPESELDDFLHYFNQLTRDFVTSLYSRNAIRRDA